jgi:hypothetical protein
LGALNNWLTAKEPISDKEKTEISFLQSRLHKFVDYWNEADLKAFFILPVINLVDFYSDKKFRAFLEATTEGNLKNVNNETVKMRGSVEFLVATGEQKPRNLFFFVNEYKPQLKSQSDPKGQLLITMFTAQAKNEDLNLPIYGLYTIGRNWYFVLLQNKQYAVSRQFDATEDDVWQIVTILKKTKLYIEENYLKIISSK